MRGCFSQSLCFRAIASDVGFEQALGSDITTLEEVKVRLESRSKRV